jgi:pimeloyl-ACP methyl ester carboxylesterase
MPRRISVSWSLGISIGGTFALQAAEHEDKAASAVIAISADSQTAVSDASSYSFLEEQARGDDRLARKTVKLGPPPYPDATALRRRATLLADLGTIERGKTFGALLREMLVDMLRAYGVLGTARALRNMNLIQHRLLREIDSLDLIANPPRLSVPVHYVFGENDALTPESLARDLPAALAAPSTTVVRVPDAGHMVHFDHPEIVRSIVSNEMQRLMEVR